MTAKDLRKKYFDFFVAKRHKILPNVSLIPENDPTALFISAGMHPLVPYLLGEPHPLGKRLVSNQRCLRTDDIDEVGDKVHHTFFEMLGNWSLGEYWKGEAIRWSFEFLTSNEWLGIDKSKLAVSVFAGDEDAPFDQESYGSWIDLGISDTRIAKLPKKDNWWGPAGQTGPCGPDTEMFSWVGKGKTPETFDPEDVNWVEVWNDVFMEYDRKIKNQKSKIKNASLTNEDFEFVPLEQRNVDTGMGLERTLAVLNGFDDDYQTEVFRPIVQSIEVLSGQKYEDEKNKKPMRIIADHLRAATFSVADGVVPGNVEQGYVLRRLIRRAIRFGRVLSAKGGQVINKTFTPEVVMVVIETMKADYPELEEKQNFIFETLVLEEEKFRKTLERGLKEIEKQKTLDGKIAFYLYETYGFPLEMTEEIAIERGQKTDKKVFEEEFRKHQELSRTASAGRFKGGLADHSEIATKYHTATHLLQAALRQVLGKHVGQKGSNITAERLRFDFSHPEKLSAEQIKTIENLVNEKIKENLPVEMEMMSLWEAKKKGAIALFGGKYGEKVKVYSIGPSPNSGQVFSMEVCGGPHVDFTGQLGKFKIIKEEAAGAGIRRIYAILQ